MTELISCIMPSTSTRRDFVPRAIKMFLAQDYPQKELILVDDGTIHENLSELVPDQRGIEYVYIDRLLCDATLTLGAKRNLACSLARGSIICHVDDDDWYSPARLSRQVEPILRGDADCTAMKMSHTLDLSTGTLYQCPEAAHKALFAHDVRSGTLMYKASYWRDGLSYPNVSRGEDVAFLHGLVARGARLQQIVSPESYICVRHGGNVSDGLDYAGWKRVALEQYLTPEDVAFYRSFREDQANAA